ncbi:MAG: hypothetical protein EOP22_01565 [Hyphomicrobiales bacterium]|nr:MAG: hypothetical protein EOP22_01565 [Hyphomicrobiales bacterium]
MSLSRTLPAALAIALMLSAAATVPSSAQPNDGRYQSSNEGRRNNMCGLYWDLLKVAEREADKRSGTKAAEKYAKEADSWWEAGENAGCSWAA